MGTQARIGAVAGGISIAFSTLCFAITPVFAPAFVLAAFFGATSGAIALALKARRTAIVAFAFALAPFCGFLLVQHAAERVRSGYVAFAPLIAAFAVALWAFINYSRARRSAASTAA